MKGVRKGWSASIAERINRAQRNLSTKWGTHLLDFQGEAEVVVSVGLGEGVQLDERVAGLRRVHDASVLLGHSVAAQLHDSGPRGGAVTPGWGGGGGLWRGTHFP